MDLDYAYTRRPARVDAHVAHRSTADPVCVQYKGKYFLFSTNQYGYWWSADLSRWHYLPCRFKENASGDQVCAPAAWPTKKGVLFLPCFLAQDKMPLYLSKNPLSARWTEVLTAFSPIAWDPSFFEDSDGRLYLYWGSSNLYPLYGIELDSKSYKPLGKPVELLHLDQKKHGWEQFGEDNQNGKMDPFIEGAWMNKFQDRYYLQYGAPGTEFNIYGDGVYVGDKPLGPFTYQKHNPFSWKPTGFARGAGHGATFQDNFGNLWHVATMDISVKDTFERRIGLFPAGVDQDGVLFCDTAFGDYPHRLPSRTADPHSNFTGWMLLSYQKPAQADAASPGHDTSQAFDEDIKTYWSSPDASPGRFLSVDLGRPMTIRAVQINYADEQADLWGKQTNICHRYKLLVSNDGKLWRTAIDKSKSNKDTPHAYIELARPIEARFVKLENVAVPTGNFAVQDLRIFGKAPGMPPEGPDLLQAERSKEDRRNLTLRWPKVEGAYAYAIDFGAEENKLYSSLLVYSKENYTLHGLNADSPYYFRIRAVSESGIANHGAAAAAP